MVKERYRSALQVSKLAELNAERIGARLAGVFGPAAEPDKPVPDWPHVIRMIARTLMAMAERLLDADRALIDEMQDDHEPLERRERARSALFQRMGSLRAMTRGIYGESALGRVGLTGNTPIEPDALHRLGKHVLENLDALENLPPAVAGGVLNIATVREDLTALVEALGQALDDLAYEAHKRDVAQQHKKSVMAEFDAQFSYAAHLLESLFGWAGETALAARVRPSTRQPGRLDQPPDDGEPNDEPNDEPGNEPSDA
jgi:hypothetical protein